MQRRSCVMQQSARHAYACHHPARWQHRTGPAASSSTTAPAAPRPPQHAAAAAPSRTLFVGGLPAKIAADQLEQLLAAVCVAAGCNPTWVQVVGFDSEAQRKRFAHGWLHKGFGLVAFQDEASVATAAAAIRANIPDWGLSATLGPARKVPDDWPAHLTYTSHELAEMQEQAAALQARRDHNRRQRQRQSARLIESVAQLLFGLQPPFGAAAQQLYRPLLSEQACQQLQQLAAAVSASQQDAAAAAGDADAHSSINSAQLPPVLEHCLRWSVLQALLQQQQQEQQQQGALCGPIQLAAAPPFAEVEQCLLLDWSRVPPLLDPAFGGRLADADVVRAGRGRMNLRALRKRVQVESFALLLWQLLTQHHQPSAASRLSSSSSSSNAGSAAAADSGTTSSPLHVVEFGSGSGNLILPLAHLFPAFSFTAVDMKPSAVLLLQQRVEQAGQRNVTAQLGRIEDYTGPADVVLALHACGSATDWALMQAASRHAAFIVSPCCIGKINRHSSSSSSGGSSGGSSVHEAAEQASCQPQQQQQQRNGSGLPRFPDANRGLQYPRSQKLRVGLAGLAEQVQQELAQQQQQQQQQQPGHAPMPLNKLQEAVVTSSGGSVPEQLFSILAATADFSHQEDHSHPELAALAKTNVELDRGMCMREAGYRVELCRLLQPHLTAKSDVLVGWWGGVADV